MWAGSGVRDERGGSGVRVGEMTPLGRGLRRLEDEPPKARGVRDERGEGRKMGVGGGEAWVEREEGRGGGGPG